MLELMLKQSLESAHDIESLSTSLEWFLNSGCSVFVDSDGERHLLLGRVLVDRINGLKIHIYAQDHAPPHFHVKSANFNASFTIDACVLLEGSVDGKTRELVTYWHSVCRPKLIEIWNNTRLTNCPVGPIRE
jgi:hypothetical protein